MPTPLKIIVESPVWVWLVLAYLIYNGYKALSTRTMNPYHLFITPVIFIIWSFSSFYTKNCINPGLLGWWALFLSLGAVFGFRIMQKLNIQVDRTTKQITIPGSTLPLIFSVLFFAVKYILSKAMVTWPATKDQLIFQLISMGSAGLISGMSVGRVLSVLAKFSTRTKR